MIIQAEASHLIDAMFLYKSCVPGMNHEGLFNWNTAYPRTAEVERDILQKNLFIYSHRKTSIGVFCLNTEEPDEYRQVSWKYKGPFLVVHRLAVHPVWRNQKVAEKMMDFAYSYARENNYNSIRLDAITKNPSALILYKKCAYEPVGNIHFSYQKDAFQCMEIKIK